MSSDDLVINGYRLTNLMMSGQNSQVWEAVQEVTGRHYAMKLLLPETARDPEQRKYLANEAKVGMALSHPKIVNMLEYNPDKENPYIVMEFFPSTNMKLRIMRGSDVLTQHARVIIEQAAQALGYMHDKGWVHKDVKPDNVLINGAGEVRLIDFALAERMASKWRRLLHRRRRIVKGTRSYMSPEQIRGESLDERADVYSFGCTLYELFGSRPPFRADSPRGLLVKHLYEPVRNLRSLNERLTPEMDELIMRMLSKKREERPANMHEFLAEFRKVKLYADENQCGEPAS